MEFDNGNLLVKAVSERGWNLYDSTNLDGNSRGCDGTIRNGPVSKLAVGCRYALMPATGESNSPRDVLAALESVAVALNREMPTILLHGQRHPLTGFRIISTDKVKVNTPDGQQHISYRQAVEAAGTLFDTRRLRYG